jgi:Flp pilus assembly protein TadG
MIVRKFSDRARAFHRDRGGSSAVEFAIMGAVMIGLMFGFYDVAFAMYVRNSFNHTVGAAAREVYVNPDRTESEIETDIFTRLSKYSDDISVSAGLETSGGLEYRTITVQMVYHYKSPFLSNIPVTLQGETRAPILDYKLDEEEEAV